jgi:hypothetical protein
MKLLPFLLFIVFLSCNETRNTRNSVDHSLTNNQQIASTSILATNNFDSVQIEIIKQQAWENLTKVAGTERDYTTTIRLRIANGNVIDADCKLIFRKESWAIASVIVDDYKGVLRNTSPKIFAVFYKLITDPGILANEINVTGLWRPWHGSHVHIEGRGLDVGYIRSSMGSGAIFNFATSGAENNYARTVRQSLISDFPTVNQYLSPWFICNPPPSCSVNNGQTSLERIHRDHLHLTLSQ